MPAPRARVISPGCTTYPAVTVSPKSLRNVLIDAAMVGRGVAESFTSMGTSVAPVSITTSTSVSVIVRQKSTWGRLQRVATADGLTSRRRFGKAPLMGAGVGDNRPVPADPGRAGIEH